MTEIKTKQLHFAAYLKASGAEFLKYSQGKFYFLSDKPLNEWLAEHTNSFARRVDLELLALRTLQKNCDQSTTTNK